MKPYYRVSTLILGLAAACLFACQDQNVVAPEADQLSPDGQLEAWNAKPAPPTASVALSGVFEAEPSTGGTWGIKKDLLTIRAEQGTIFIESNLPAMTGTDWEAYLDRCREVPEGANVDHLITALKEGLSGGGATIVVDLASLDPVMPDADNRLFVFNLQYPVRYFWVGSWYETGDGTVSDAIVTDYENNTEFITYTLSGGAIGLRDNAGPKETRKIHCPNLWSVTVTVTK